MKYNYMLIEIHVFMYVKLFVLSFLLIAKIKPRRNSTLAPPRGPRRQASEHKSTTSGGARPLSPTTPTSHRQPHSLYRQESSEVKVSPSRSHAPMSPSSLEDTPIIRRNEQATPTDHTPSSSATKLQPNESESMIELSEITIDPSLRDSDTNRVNTSTPIGEIDPSPSSSPYIQTTSVSVIVDGRSNSLRRGEESEGSREEGGGRLSSSPLSPHVIVASTSSNID